MTKPVKSILKKTKADQKTKLDRKAQRDKRKFDFERNTRTIFVGNLPNTYDHKDVAKLFKVCGPVESARIRSVVPEKEKLPPKVALITKRMHSKVNSVNAYVVFEKTDDDSYVMKALKMNGKKIDGHHIRVDRAQRPKVKRETLASRKKSIFVGNLRFDIRDDDLFNYFEKVGPVNYVRIVRDSSTGLGKGFGFVVFQDRASVRKALDTLNESNFKGRKIRIKKVERDDKAKSERKADKGKQKRKEKEHNQDEEVEEQEDEDDDHNDQDYDDDDDEGAGESDES